MIISPRFSWRKVIAVTIVPLVLAASWLVGPLPPLISPFAAMAAPAVPAEPEACEHVATADTIKVYYCEDSGLYVNQLGFMTFQP